MPGLPAESGRRQSGAALVVGLVLLLAVTVLGAAGVGMAAVELAMAGNAQAKALAFEAAETGIETALAGILDPSAPSVYESVAAADGGYEFDAAITCVGWSRVPDGTSGEQGATAALHYLVTAEGRGPRGAVSRHAQGVYVIAPGPGPRRFDPADEGGGCTRPVASVCRDVACFDAGMATAPVRTFWRQDDLDD